MVEPFDGLMVLWVVRAQHRSRHDMVHHMHGTLSLILGLHLGRTAVTNGAKFGMRIAIASAAEEFQPPVNEDRERSCLLWLLRW